MKIQDKVLVVTGAGNGVGRAVALEALRRGARVAGVDISQAGLDETAALAAAGDDLWTRQLDVTDKATRVHNFHQNTLHALRDLLCAAGLEHPGELGPEHILRRVSPTEVRSIGQLYRFLSPGDLLSGKMPVHAVFQQFWAGARTDSFDAPAQVSALRIGKSV